MEFLRHTLTNGLEVIAEANGEAHSTAVGFFVMTGARDESDSISGVSHFLEHMMFKGTPTRSADDVNREFDEMGAHYNACTSEENTIYYGAVLPEMQTPLVELLADILRPSLRVEDFDTEKQVIIEEIRMYDDQPPFGGYDKCRALHFGEHPLARSVLGTAESVGNLPVEAMREYFERRYSPGNIVLAAAGRVDFDALVESADRLCGDWQPHEAGRETPPAKRFGGFRALQKPSATQQYVIQLSNAPAADDADRYAARVLSVVLGDDSGSRLYWELVDPGLAEHASVGYDGCQGAGLYVTYLSCEPDDVAENLRRVEAVLSTAQRDGVTPEELAQAKSKICSRIVLGSERTWARLFAVGGNWIDLKRHLSVAESLAAFDAVTRDDLARVLQQYPLTHHTTVAIGPLESVAPPDA